MSNKGKRVAWSPTPKQREFLACSAREALYGGSLGGGKSDACLMAAVSQVKNPAHRALVLRRSFPQLRDLVQRSMDLFPNIGGVFNVQTSTWTFGKAKVEFAFLDSPTDVLRYQGRAWNTLVWEELCEFPNPDEYIYLLTRLRTTKGSGVRLEVRASANPLGVGAHWVRKRFNIPADGSASECIDPDTGYRRVFIPARLSDNVHLQGSAYERQLQALPLHQRRALLEGRWDQVAGSMFGDAFSYDKHVIDEFPIPATWQVWRGCDDGWSNEAAVLWLTENREGDGTIYILQEYYAKHQTPQMLAENVLALDRSIQVDCGDEIVPNDMPLDGEIDSAAFSMTGAADFSRADQMNQFGTRWRPVEKGQGSRIAGCACIHARLATRDDGTAGLKIFRRCKNLIRVLPTLVVDPRNSEDYDPDGETHLVDALRYGLARKAPHRTKVMRVRWAH